jgi:hypothetical protein
VSGADVSEVDDVHAMEVRVSLMQKEIAQIKRPSSIIELAELPTPDGRRFPSDHVQCAGEMAMKTVHMTVADYDAVVASLRRIYENLNSFCGAEDCEQSHWAGCILRLAAHDFMDYSMGSGGADGCVNLDDPDNAGLSDCLIGGPSIVGLTQVYENFCTNISLADFLVISAEAVMNITRDSVLKVDPDRQALDFRSRFKYGRVTQKTCDASFGRMPDAERSCAAVEENLLTRLGLTWDQAAALMGAHTIGGASISNSGYIGRWKQANASRLFDNGYFTSLVLKGWSPLKAVADNPGKNAWRRADIGTDFRNKGYEMMLDSDMCLYHSFYDHESDPSEFHAATAHDQGCSCAWVRPVMFLDAIVKYNSGEFCGTTNHYALEDPYVTHSPSEEHFADNTIPNPIDPGNKPNLNTVKQRLLCCGLHGPTSGSTKGPQETQYVMVPSSDCGEASSPKGPAAAAVILFANDEDAWIAAYYEAWGIVTTKGKEDSLSPLVL